MSTQTSTNELQLSLTGFLRFLRQQNFSDISISDTRDVLNWLHNADIDDINGFQSGLKALLCRSLDDWQKFDDYYEGYWHISAQEILENTQQFTPSRKSQSTGGIAGVSHHQLLLRVMGTDNRQYQSGASAQDTLVYHDFRFLFDEHQRKVVESLIKPMVRRALIKKQRRYQSSKFGAINIKATLQQCVKNGGDLSELKFRKRRRIRPPIIVFIDFSQSMEGYSPIYTLLAMAMHELLPNVRVYAFDTHLIDLNPALSQRQPEARHHALEQLSDIWKGGTKIGSSLNEFLVTHSRQDLSPNSRIIICSDGSESKDQDELLDALRTLRSNSYSITWLDPLLSRIPESQEPERVVMARNQLRQLTHNYLPGHSIDALRNAVSRL